MYPPPTESFVGERTVFSRLLGGTKQPNLRKAWWFLKLQLRLLTGIPSTWWRWGFFGVGWLETDWVWLWGGLHSPPKKTHDTGTQSHEGRSWISSVICQVPAVSFSGGMCKTPKTLVFLETFDVQENWVEVDPSRERKPLPKLFWESERESNNLAPIGKDQLPLPPLFSGDLLNFCGVTKIYLYRTLPKKKYGARVPGDKIC